MFLNLESCIFAYQPNIQKAAEREIRSENEGEINMELQQLRYLVTLSSTLNFSRAAEELYISQPTLSQQIRKLEEELGVRLVERSTRNVQLTAIGQRCVQLAMQAVEAADRMAELAQEENRRFSSRLNIGVLTVYPQLNISSIIAEFQALHLNETINMHFDWSAALMERLRRHKSDVIITNLDQEALSRSEADELEIYPFLQDKLYMIVGEKNPLYDRQTVELREVLCQRLFMPGRSSSVNMFFIKAVQAAGFEMPEFTECPSITSTFNFLVTGQGAAVMSRHVSQSYLKPGMRMIEITPTIHTCTAIVTRKELLKRPLVREFCQFFLSQERAGMAD